MCSEPKFPMCSEGWGSGTNFQLLMLSPNLLKSYIYIFPMLKVLLKSILTNRVLTWLNTNGPCI